MIKDLKNCVRDETGLPVPSDRQYALRRLLEANSSRWMSGADIFCAMDQTEDPETGIFPSPYCGDPKKAYKQINEDVRFLNVCGRFDKMILGDRSKGYKLATQAEFEEWARKKRDEMVGGLEYLGILCRNAKLDGQAILNIFNQPCLREERDCFVKEEGK